MKTPDRWVIVKIVAPEETIYKVLAGWGGSFTQGASWQLNSGIESYTETEKYYDFKGYSGSVYRCNKGSEGLSAYTATILSSLQGLLEDKVTQVPVQEALENI